MANTRAPLTRWRNRNWRVVIAVVGAAITVIPVAAGAHDWYPNECCSGNDCAPAESVLRRADGSYEVFVRGMSVLIPSGYDEWKRSPDGRIHVCVREYLLACAFRGPGV